MGYGTRPFGQTYACVRGQDLLCGNCQSARTRQRARARRCLGYFVMQFRVLQAVPIWHGPRRESPAHRGHWRGNAPNGKRVWKHRNMEELAGRVCRLAQAALDQGVKVTLASLRDGARGGGKGMFNGLQGSGCLKEMKADDVPAAAQQNCSCGSSTLCV